MHARARDATYGVRDKHTYTHTHIHTYILHILAPDFTITFMWGSLRLAPTTYVRLSVDQIAYNRISTRKTEILRARAGYIAPRHLVPARALDPAAPAYELTKRPGYSLLSPRALSLNLRRLSVRAVAEISMR